MPCSHLSFEFGNRVVFSVILRVFFTLFSLYLSIHDYKTTHTYKSTTGMQ